MIIARAFAALIWIEIHVADPLLRFRSLLIRHLGSGWLLGGNQMGVWRLALMLILAVLRKDCLLLLGHYMGRICVRFAICLLQLFALTY